MGAIGGMPRPLAIQCSSALPKLWLESSGYQRSVGVNASEYHMNSKSILVMYSDIPKFGFEIFLDLWNALV